MYYRFFIPSDFEALYAIEVECFEPPLRFPREYMQLLLDDADSATWIAERNGAMVGFGIVEWSLEGEQGDKDRKTVAYLHTVEVTPAQRGQGVGAELLRRLEESAREAEAASIWLHVDETNAGAIRIYTARGFKYESREEDYYGPARAGLVYRKRLGAEAEAK